MVIHFCVRISCMMMLFNLATSQVKVSTGPENSNTLSFEVTIDDGGKCMYFLPTEKLLSALVHGLGSSFPHGRNDMLSSFVAKS